MLLSCQTDQRLPLAQRGPGSLRVQASQSHPCTRPGSNQSLHCKPPAALDEHCRLAARSQPIAYYQRPQLACFQSGHLATTSRSRGLKKQPPVRGTYADLPAPRVDLLLGRRYCHRILCSTVHSGDGSVLQAKNRCWPQALFCISVAKLPVFSTTPRHHRSGPCRD